MSKKKQTNAEYARTNEAFINACERARCKPTRRQASKFRNKRGLAYKASRNA